MGSPQLPTGGNALHFSDPLTIFSITPVSFV